MKILNDFERAESYHTRGLAEGLWEKYHLISNEAIRKRIIEITNQNTSFAEGFNDSLYLIFPYMTEDMQEKVLDMEIIYYKFASNLARIICQNYLHLNEKIKRKVWKKFEDNREFASSMRHDICDILNVLGPQDQEYIFSIIAKDFFYAGDSGYALGGKYAYLKREFQERLLTLINNNKYDNKFIINFGIGLGRYFSYLQDDLQKKILEIGNQHSDFISNLMRSLGERFSILEEDEQERIWNKALKDEGTAKSISFDIGFNFPNLNKKMQIKALEMAEKDVHFAINFMRGIRYIESDSIDPEFQKRILKLTEGTDKITMSLRRGLNNTI